MAPKRATRSTRVPPVTPAPNATTTTVTEAQLQALINQGVAAAMAEAEASRVRNGYNSNGSGPRPAQTARECSYSEFLKCKPLDFKGTEGVVGLTRWFEKMESVFSISNCPAASQVKFATCTLQDDALTWWNSHVKTTTPEVAHAMPWAALKKMMTDKYCPKGEIKKIETEMWNLKVKGTDVVAYNRRFQQLALMCSRMFPEEVDKIEKYIGGLPDMILGSVKASKSKTMQEVIEFTTELMEDKTHFGGVTPSTPWFSPRIRLANNNNNNNNNRNNNNNNQQGNGCFECGAQGHFKRNCLKLNNNDCGNQAGNNRAPAKVYAIGNVGANPDNVVAGTFLLNNRYAYILFDTGADRSFVSTAFSTLLDIIPNTLDHGYNVELADVNFQIDLVPGAAPVARAPYRLAPSEMKELSEQLKTVLQGLYKTPVPHPGSSRLVWGQKKERIIPGSSRVEYLLEDRPKVRLSPTEEQARARRASEDNIGVVEERGVYLIGSEDFIAYCDASKKGLGAVLIQREKCLLSDLRTLSYGTTSVIVFTDHKSLQTHSLSEKELNMKTTLMGKFLMNTIAIFVIYPGKENVVELDAIAGNNEQTPLISSELYHDN
ncbi:reverse transcriptase domain-containing protein [Tanacetum coccineum]